MVNTWAKKQATARELDHGNPLGYGKTGKQRDAKSCPVFASTHDLLYIMANRLLIRRQRNILLFLYIKISFQHITNVIIIYDIESLLV